MIYLDHNATTPVAQEAQEAMAEALKRGFGNPSSTHAPGRMARELVESARQSLAKLLGCLPQEVFLTSGGTESNNLAILGTAAFYRRGHIITSAVEHPSVAEPMAQLEQRGFEITRVGVDSYGRVRAEDVSRSIRHDTVLISIMHSNNETGVLQPVREIAMAARAKGISFHTDAAQSVGKVRVEAGEEDMVTVAAHKFYGPKGIGALYVRKGVTIMPILFGAGHESGLRPGTEAVPAIAGMGAACELALRELGPRAERIASLSGLFLKELDRMGVAYVLNGHPELRLSGTLNLCLPGSDASALVEAMGDTVAMSAGSACHSGLCRPSAVLKAMGLTDRHALSSVRISLGKDNTEDEMITAAGMLSAALSR